MKTVCDVGASVGTVSLPLSKMYPHLKIIDHDLPEVLVQAKDVRTCSYLFMNYFASRRCDDCEANFVALHRSGPRTRQRHCKTTKSNSSL